MEIDMRNSRNNKPPKQPNYLKRRTFAEGKAQVDAAHVATWRLYCEVQAFRRRCPGAVCKRHRRCTGEPAGRLMRGLPSVPPAQRLKAEQKVIAGGPRRIAAAAGRFSAGRFLSIAGPAIGRRAGPVRQDAQWRTARWRSRCRDGNWSRAIRSSRSRNRDDRRGIAPLAPTKRRSRSTATPLPRQVLLHSWSNLLAFDCLARLLSLDRAVYSFSSIQVGSALAGAIKLPFRKLNFVFMPARCARFIRPREAGEGDHWSSRSERTVVGGGAGCGASLSVQKVFFAGRSEREC